MAYSVSFLRYRYSGLITFKHE
jgi:hypothetical protein